MKSLQNFKWTELPDQPEYGNYVRQKTQDGYEICVYRVLFGFRVRFGKYKALSYGMDWCCGDSPFSIALLYVRLMNLVETVGSKEVLEKYPPISAIKPYFKDTDFLEKVFDNGYIIDEKVFESITLKIKNIT